ncbi:D-psicose 3-epimerase [Ensifer adhaerens]|uniref:sugar phosphate isomerase/epimerase family protein n=1 Tax=Ensifer adhaerens TaxID=106592 RepID=UPI0015686E29|nr:sugar phosphate isomerase/epimerase family protein [Ensifer adhaerens]NRP21625.1 D-psicose 3-epimerase [Ensifer adhaerens]
MLNRKQLIGANFSFQHHPFRWTAEHLCAMGFDRMELWGIAPHLDLFHDSCAQRFLHAADICAELGATYLFLTPGRGFECESRDIAFAHSVASITRIAAHARDIGVSCLLEPLQPVESNILTNADELYALRRSLDDDHIDVVLDLVAMATAGDSVLGYFERFAKCIAHVHVVDGTPAGHLAWGDGNLPLSDYLAELGMYGFTGTLTFEPFGNGSYALDPPFTWRRCLEAVAPHFNQVEQA